MPTFDGENLIITLDSGVTNIDWIDIYSDWKDWMLADPLNRGYPEAFRTTGGDPLNLLLDAGKYWFLRNDYGWRIKPPEEHITILAAGNLAPEDADIDMFLPTAGAYTTQILGLQPITQGFSVPLAIGLEQALYNERVTIDVVDGVSGAGYDVDGNPIGTFKTPSNNIPDALLIAAARGFSDLIILGDITLDTGDNPEGMKISGQGTHRSTITINTGADVLDCLICDAAIQGTLDGVSTIEDCSINDLDFVNGEIKNCEWVGKITLGGSEEAHFSRTRSGVPGTGTPELDCGGSGQGFQIRGHYGGIKVSNKTGPEPGSIDMDSGQIQLAATVNITVENSFVCRGVGAMTEDLSTGYPVVNQMNDARKLIDLHLLQGLDADNPMTVTPTTRIAGDIDQAITGDGVNSTTVTRQ